MCPMPAPRLGDRSLFPDLEAAAYLGHAAVSPPSMAVRLAAIAQLGELARAGQRAFPAALEQRSRLRAKLATLLGCDDDEVAIVPNTSLGITDVALCVPWKPGDRVLCFEGEFPANVTPWQRAAELFGLSVVFHPVDRFRTDPDAAWSALDDELSRGVRVVAVSAVQFQTGYRVPLGRLCAMAHSAGGEVCVDAIQALGGVPLDVRREGVDYLASGGHKWLMGLEGAGVLYARRELAAKLRPHVAGWLGHPQPFRFLSEGAGHLRYDRPLEAGARMVEAGTFSAIGCVALEASLDLLLGLGVEAIHRHVNAYLDPLEAALVARGFRSLRSPDANQRSGILGLVPPVGRGLDAPGWQRELSARGVVASCPDGVLRIAPHWPNGAHEHPAILRAVDAVLHNA